MFKLITFGSALFVGLVGLTLLTGRARAGQPDSGIAVVELFTSEGCSSCPPADAALADLIANRGDRHVYAMEFHVDYWNDLGWADPFSSAAFSTRQTAYAQAFRLDSVYTPQAFVNGKTELLGSDRQTLHRTVDAALATATTATIDAAVKAAGGRIGVMASGKDLPADTVVNFALAQRGLTTTVRRGENGGRTLTHQNVVRGFQSVTADKDGHATASLTMPAGAAAKDCSIIVYAQRPGDGHVVAATEVACLQ